MTAETRIIIIYTPIGPLDLMCIATWKSTDWLL